MILIETVGSQFLKITIPGYEEDMIKVSHVKNLAVEQDKKLNIDVSHNV